MNLKFDWTVLQAVWCEKCNKTWYIGRVTIVETFEISESIKKLIIEWKSTIDLYSSARENWYLTLQEDWIIKVLNWETTLDELRRIL
jgi:type II secretory ATPase GspE/PulE/Tfp pilus assembly ATPase PilB-like protein